MINSPVQQCVDDVILSRRSVRAFLPDALSEEDVLSILEVAQRAPSGSNTQPWKVYVLMGNKLQELSAAILDAHNHPSLISRTPKNITTIR